MKNGTLVSGYWPPKNLGIFDFLEFLKVVAYDSTMHF